MEIPVTLVPSIDAQAWPNEIYVGYATGWMRRYDQEFDPDNPAPQKLQPYLADAKTQGVPVLAYGAVLNEVVNFLNKGVERSEEVICNCVDSVAADEVEEICES